MKILLILAIIFSFNVFAENLVDSEELEVILLQLEHLENIIEDLSIKSDGTIWSNTCLQMLNNVEVLKNHTNTLKFVNENGEPAN